VNLGICVTCWYLCAAFEPIFVRCGLNLYVLFENAMVPCKKTLDFTEWKIWSLVSASLVRYELKARKYVHKLSYQLCAGLFHSIQSYQRSWRIYRLSFDLALAHLRCGKVDFAFGHWSKKVNIFDCVVSTVDPDSEFSGHSRRDLSTAWPHHSSYFLSTFIISIISAVLAKSSAVFWFG